VEVERSRSSTEKGAFITMDDLENSDDVLGEKRENPMVGIWRRRSLRRKSVLIS
jgi:hypothetical protein